MRPPNPSNAGSYPVSPYGFRVTTTPAVLQMPKRPPVNALAIAAAAKQNFNHR